MVTLAKCRTSLHRHGVGHVFVAGEGPEVHIVGPARLVKKPVHRRQVTTGAAYGLLVDVELVAVATDLVGISTAGHGTPARHTLRDRVGETRAAIALRAVFHAEVWVRGTGGSTLLERHGRVVGHRAGKRSLVLSVGVAAEVAKVAHGGGRRRRDGQIRPDVEAPASSAELRAVSGAGKRAVRGRRRRQRHSVAAPAFLAIFQPEVAVADAVLSAHLRRHVGRIERVAREYAGGCVDETTEIRHGEHGGLGCDVLVVDVHIQTVAGTTCFGGISSAGKGAVGAIRRLGGENIAAVALAAVLETEVLGAGAERGAGLHRHAIVRIAGHAQRTLSVGVVHVASFRCEGRVSLVGGEGMGCRDQGQEHSRSDGRAGGRHGAQHS